MDQKNLSLLLGMSDHALYDLVSSFPEPAHLKDILTKKYIHSNKKNLQIYGINDPKTLIGLTVHDLDCFMRPYWGEGFANKVNDLDSVVAERGTVIRDEKRIFLDKFGLVHVQDMTKAPVTNTSDKVTAILTLSFDVTNKTNKFFLFDKYKKIYTKKREANLYFMKHLKIDVFFSEILTEKEIVCFLHMLDGKAYKYIAAKMQVSIKTIETHISNISHKTLGKNLASIVECLKMCSNDVSFSI